MKIYNIWICVEEIGRDEEDGKDIHVGKVAQFEDQEKAIDFCNYLVKYNNTARNEYGFTI